MFDRVEYYAPGDFLYAMGLRRIETILVPEFSEVDINDAIEFFQIHKYFKDGTRFRDWSDEQYEMFKKKSNALFGLTHRFFNALHDGNIVDEYNKVQSHYHAAFWELFEQTKKYSSISEEVFDQLIHSEHVPFYDVFGIQNTVEKFGKCLHRIMLENELGVGIIIHFFQQQNDKARKQIYLPNVLTKKEIASCLEQYIDREFVNPNDLITIFYIQPNKRFSISDELRLKAKKRYEKEVEKTRTTGKTYERKLSVFIDKDQKEVFKDHSFRNNLSFSYSEKWLLETLDNSSILNNFIYVFEYADYQQMRCNLASVESSGGTIEKVFRSKSDRFYPDYIEFIHHIGMATMQMHAYYHFLLQNNIRFEDVLQWFFTDYLQKEFQCPQLRVQMPSAQTTILEKCESICTAMETVVKQYSLFAEKRTIDFELLALKTRSPNYGSLPSLVREKYIYGHGKDFENIQYLLFSDQCLLAYVERICKGKNRSFSCFVDLLLQEKVFKSDYPEYDHSLLDLLIKNRLISISPDGEIKLGDKKRLYIMRELYHYEVISRWHFADEVQRVFQELVAEGLVCEKSTLLTEPESKFFNYVLNHAGFLNGYDLRNKYEHGNGHYILDENKHMQNYDLLLILMTILAIKINDDLCLHEQRGKKE